ncbi:radical SAM protein [Anaerofustis sp.]|uniref:radical SAM protein n=1 Tax=Anaerofustis sp. TaxID=1872517 RepID=UPI0025C274E7|nr:radical SAM protein [Anaerofustis sp.]
MRYEGIVYRPPSEARSLIIQVTIGCSQNCCTFCNMYKDKKFRIRLLNDILMDLKEARNIYEYVEKIFLADGDALFCDTDILVEILEYIKAVFPECRQVSCYATAKSILLKTTKELITLREKGLKLLYMGIESGSDTILKKVKKGTSSKEILKAASKAKDSGFKLSVTVISGLGGCNLWEEHAIKTANILSAMDPDYIGLLTLMIEEGTELKREIETGSFRLMNPYDILKETRLMIEKTECTNAVFRSNHASNYISLKGVLSKDKKMLLNILDQGIDGKVGLKEEYMRGL